MLETQKVDYSKICKAIFGNLHPSYVTDMRYLEADVNVSFYLQFSGKYVIRSVI